MYIYIYIYINQDLEFKQSDSILHIQVWGYTLFLFLINTCYLGTDPVIEQLFEPDIFRLLYAYMLLAHLNFIGTFECYWPTCSKQLNVAVM